MAQSGNNVVAYDGTAARVEQVVRQVLASRFALDVDMIVRDEKALRALIADRCVSGWLRRCGLDLVVMSRAVQLVDERVTPLAA